LAAMYLLYRKRTVGGPENKRREGSTLGIPGGKEKNKDGGKPGRLERKE